MSTKNENIEFWLGRTFMLFFFVFIVSFSRGNSNSQNASTPYSFEQLIDVNSFARIVEHPEISNYNASLVEFVLYNHKTEQLKLGLFISCNKIEQQFKCEDVQFLKLKPKLLKRLPVHFKAYSDKDYPLNS